MSHWMGTYALLVIQVTFVTVTAGIAYVLTMRRRAAIARRFLGFTLFLVLGITATTFLPLPDSWSMKTWLRESRIVRRFEPGSCERNSPRPQARPDASEAPGVLVASAVAAGPEQPEAGSFPAPEPRVGGRWWAIAFALLLAIGGSIVCIRLLRCLWLTYRLVRRSTKVQDVALLELAEEIRLSIGCRRVEMRLSKEIAGAGTIGWYRPLLIIAADWQEWSERERRAVLAHELAHVRSRDYLTGVMARLARALYFYHPLVRWLTTSFFLAQEAAADAQAARLVDGRANYLVALSRIALRQDRQSNRGPVMAFASSSSTLLTRRIELLESTDVPLSRRIRLFHQSAFVCLVLGAVAASALRLPAQDGQPTSATAAGVELDPGTEAIGGLMAAGPGKEITGGSEKRSLAGEMLEKYKANSEAIRTWIGKVDTETVDEYEGKKRTTKATVSFWSDERSHSNKTIREIDECFEEDAKGGRRNLVRENGAVLLKDGETYSFPTHFHPDSPHQPSLRKLRVGQDPKEIGLDKWFFPTLGAMNESAYRGYFIETFFPCLMKAPDESLSKIPMWREGSIVTVIDKLEQNGALVLTNTRVFDLDRAANLTRFEYEAPCIQKRERWRCEYQQVDGIWIPKRTESTIEYYDRGMMLHRKTDWRDQSLNGDVAEELSPATLGACRGDQVYDCKADALYLIEDKDHPVHTSRILPKAGEFGPPVKTSGKE